MSTSPNHGLDIDDILLSQLTEEEIAELNNMIDPDNSLLPASDRMPDHTVKKSTKDFDRDQLLTHLKKEAKESTVGEDYVPYIPKAKSIQKDDPDQRQQQAKVEIVTEFDDVLKDMDEADLAELASELGLHSLLNQAQSRGDKNAPMRAKASPLMQHRIMNLNFEIPQESIITDTITLLEENDSSLSDLNLNNHPLINSEHLEQIMEALKTNSCVENVSLVNVKMADKHAIVLADVIRNNDVIKTLNVESNRLSVEGIRSIVKALRNNETIREVRISNQLARFGHRTEDEIAKMLQYNTTILKFGYSFQSNGPRFEVQRHLMRNTEKERQKRQNLAV